MSNNTLESLVTETVQSQIGQQNEFTAWDITREVRLAGMRCFHDDVKRIVHELYADGEMAGYDRELRSYRSGTVQAWAYFPMVTQQISAVPPTHVAPSAVARTYAPPGASNPALLPNHSPSTSISESRKVDARGTLCVSASMMRSVGFLPGTYATVLSLQAEQRLIVGAPTGGHPPKACKTYRVNKYGNIRITRARQREANLSYDYYQLAPDPQARVIQIKAA